MSTAMRQRSVKWWLNASLRMRKRENLRLSVFSSVANAERNDVSNAGKRGFRRLLNLEIRI